MKIILALFSLGLTFSVFSNTENLLSCVAKTVESRRLNMNTSVEFMKILNSLKNGVDTNVLLKNCEQLKKESKDLPEHSRKGAFKMVEMAIKIHPEFEQVGKIVLNLSERKIKCNVIGVEAGFSIGVGSGVGFDLGKCSSLSGKRFLMVTPEVSINYGIGAYAIIDPGQFYFYEGEKVLKRSDESEGVVGVALARSQTNAYDDVGVGIGLALIAKDEFYLPIKLVPLKRNYKELKAELGI